MNFSFLIIVLLIFVQVPIAGAQSSYTISGIVKDEKGATIPGAGILLSGYKTATVSNSDGKYILSAIRPGNYDVLVQMMGFLPFTKNVLISDKSVVLNVVLKENTIQLNEVVIKADPNRKHYIELFKDFFIGETPNSEQCKLINPHVLIVDYDNKKRILTVKANEFLILENKALGYNIKYLLEYFEYDYKTGIVYYAGHPNFEDMKASKARKNKWQKKRDIAYYGSHQHFFRSLYDNKIKEDGFIINKLVKTPESPPDSSNRRPRYINTLYRAEVLTDTLVKQVYDDVKTINYSDVLYVIYTGEKESRAYTEFSGHAINRPLDMPNYQITLINMLEAPIHFYPNGSPFNPRSTLYEGYWAYEKVGDMVPLDYIPSDRKR